MAYDMAAEQSVQYYLPLNWGEIDFNLLLLCYCFDLVNDLFPPCRNPEIAQSCKCENVKTATISQQPLHQNLIWRTVPLKVQSPNDSMYASNFFINLYQWYTVATPKHPDCLKNYFGIIALRPLCREPLYGVTGPLHHRTTIKFIPPSKLINGPYPSLRVL